MNKTAVYSWRLASDLKAALERQARMQGVSLATLLDRLAAAWIEQQSAGDAGDASQQAALRESARACIGTIAGGNPRRSENARQAVRNRLARKRPARKRHAS